MDDGNDLLNYIIIIGYIIHYYTLYYIHYYYGTLLLNFCHCVIDIHVCIHYKNIVKSSVILLYTKVSYMILQTILLAVLPFSILLFFTCNLL